MIPKDQIKELIELIEGTDISEIEVSISDDNQKIRISRNSQPVETVVPAAVTAHPAAVITPAAEPPAEQETSGFAVKAPLVGTFYASPKPGDPPYVKVGDIVTAGQIVCIIEAMKIFNEIEADISGRVVSIIAEDEQPVEYGQALIELEPV